MIYCLINESRLVEYKNVEIKYSLINDSNEIKVDKHFKIDLKKDKVIYAKFSQSQFKNNSFDNHINEISNDFNRSKYILGKIDFEKYFFNLDEFKKVNEDFKDKYMNIKDILKKIICLKNTM